MNFIRQFIAVIILVIALVLGFVLYPDHMVSIEKDFSFNLKKWHEKGNFFLYKDIYKIFYILEKLNPKEPSDLEATPTILFIHGFPTSSYDYNKIFAQFFQDNQMEHFNKPESILMFDFLGYGFSDKPMNYEYSVFDMADLVDRLVLHLNIKSVIIVSHDLGDTVAQELIRRDNRKNENHFEIIKCLMLNGGIMSKAYEPALVQRILQSEYASQIFSKYLFSFLIFRSSFKNVFGHFKPNKTELYDHFVTIKFNRGNEILPKTIGYLIERQQFNDVWVDALNETSMPILFVYGPADPINPRSRFPQVLREELPNVKLNILSELIGHYPQLEDPFTVFQIIKNFIMF